MKQISKRILSLASAALLAFAAYFSVPTDFITKADAFTPESFYVDFSQYDLANDPVFSGANSTSFSVVSDQTATGGKYLKYQPDNNGIISWNAAPRARLSTTGTQADAFRVTANALYRVKIKYKISGHVPISDAELSFVFLNADWGNLSSTDDSENVVLKSGVTNTDGWVEETFYFTAGSFYTQNDCIFMAFYPCEIGTGTYIGNKNMGKFETAIDYIDIDRIERISTLRLNNVSTDPVEFKDIKGAPGDKVTFPKGFKYYTSYEGGVLSGQIDENNYTFPNEDYTQLYYSDTFFEEEKYVVDFSGYGSDSDNSVNVNMINESTTSRWKYLSDTTATAGKYVQYNQTEPISWIANSLIDLSTDATADNQIKLKNSTDYRIKIRYRATGIEASTENRLTFAVAGTKWGQIWEPDETTLSIVEDDVKNTDGWIEKFAYISTPATYGVPASTLWALWIMPAAKGENVLKLGVNDLGSFKIDIDNIEIERCAKVELYSDGQLIESVKGVPGEVIKISELKQPTRNGYQFVGWYSDPNCLNSATDITLTNNTVCGTLFAGWTKLDSDTIVNDETYPTALRNNSNYMSGIASASEFKNGSSSFKSISNESYIMLNKDDTGFKAVNGNTYQVSFWYKSTADIQTSVFADAISGFTGNGLHSLNTFEKSSDWKRVFMTFTTDISEDKFIYLKLRTNGTVYVDDIIVTTETNIAFETNGGVALTTISGKPGSLATLPTPVNGGNTFSGWYEDKELERKCTNVFFPTDTDVITLYAGWNVKEPWVINDYEDTPFIKGNWWNASASYNQQSVSITDEVKFAGNKSLKFDYKKGNNPTADSQAFIIYKDNSDCKLEVGSTYIMTFWYKPEKLDCDVRFSAMTSYERNFWAQPVSYDSNCFMVSKSKSGSDWTKGTIVFTVDADEEHRSLFFKINPLEDVDTTVYIDNVTVDKMSDDQAVITYVYDSTSNEMAFAEIGSNLSLPTPTKSSYNFIGWYEDKEFTKPIEGLYKVKGHANIYAKWEIGQVIDRFDDYPDNWIDAEGRFSVSENVAISDTARFNNANDPSEVQGFIQLYNKDDISVSGDDPLIVEKGSAFKVTFRYKADSLNGDATIKLLTAGQKNYWANRKYGATYYISKSQAGKGWQTATIFFTSDAEDADQWNRYDALFMEINVKGTNDIYFDDVIVESMTGKVYVEFNPNNGNNSTYVVGVPGSLITVPDAPTRDYHTFMGWYTDTKYTTEFTGTKFPTKSTTLYAHLRMNDSVVFSFEDEAYRQELSDMIMKYGKVSTERSTNGKYSLKFDKADVPVDNNAFAPLYLGNQPVIVDDGATYVLTYDYYVEKGSTTTLDFYTPHPTVSVTNADNFWVNMDWTAETWRFPLQEQSGIWKTASHMFTVEYPEDNPDAKYLFFICHASQGTVIYFDNLRLVRVENNANTTIVNCNPTGATDIGNTKLTYSVKPGDKVTLPTSLKRKGYIFTGWFQDKKCTDKVINNVYAAREEDVTLYAGWAVSSIIQDFEKLADNYYAEHYKERRYGFDEDFELYDSKAQGNSASNVNGGRYSFHKIGNDHHNGAFQVITPDLNAILTRDQVYKMSMWVKMDSSKHTDGAIAIASSNYYYPWGIDGEWKNVIALKDLADGEWHKVEYTFYSTSIYFSVRVPGYASVYFDDIDFQIIENGTTDMCSQPVEASEYAVKRLSENEELAITERELDESLFKSAEDAAADIEKVKNKTDSNILVIVMVIIAVLAAAGGLSAFLIIKKKKQRRA